MAISFDELRRRKLFQWAAAYLAACWVVLQVIDLLAENFGWPGGIERGAVVLLGIGLLAVLVLGWYHGERGAQRVSGPELLMITGIFLLAGAALALVLRGDANDTALPDAAAAEAPADQSSIAVLPFSDLSPAGDQEFFSDGLTEELLNVLAQIPGLRVAARTSAFSFKDANVPVDSIARALNVAHVLEGSVRTSGSRVRITAQLINAETGYHMWSDTYERELADVLAVQDEISRAIVDALRLRLPRQDEQPLVHQLDIDPEAYVLTLRGLQIYNGQRTREGFVQAAELFHQAIARAPDYARAHATLAQVLASQAYRRYIPPDSGYDAAARAAERALSIDPGQIEALEALTRIALFHDWDFEAAEQRIDHLLEISPGYALAYALRARIRLYYGRRSDAIAFARRSAELDPLSLGALNEVGEAYRYNRRYLEAVTAYRATLELAPDAAIVYSNLAWALTGAGRMDEALATAERSLQLEPGFQLSLATLGWLYARAGRTEDARRLLRDLESQPDGSPYLAATIHAGLGDPERVLELLDRAIDEHDDGAPDLLIDPAFDSMREDPRMKRLTQRLLDR